MSSFPITFSSDISTVYYRPYQEDGVIESRSPAYSNDRFVGRILSKAVTPPHTAASLKSHLCKIEGFSGSENAHLYLSLLSQAILDDSSHLALIISWTIMVQARLRKSLWFCSSRMLNNGWLVDLKGQQDFLKIHWPTTSIPVECRQHHFTFMITLSHFSLLPLLQ